jgi:hypothetical protein
MRPRCGLGPRFAGRDEHLRGDVETDAEGVDQVRRGGPGERLEMRGVGLDLGVEIEPALRERHEGVTHRHGRVGQITAGIESRARGEELEVAQKLELFAQVLVGGDQRRPERDDRRGVGLHSGITGDLDQPDGFDLAVGELRGDDADTVERGARGVLGVDGVALAREASSARSPPRERAWREQLPPRRERRVATEARQRAFASRHSRTQRGLTPYGTDGCIDCPLR